MSEKEKKGKIGGGRKGGANTAIPHVVAREYRNTASKFSQIPKPQLQMGKSWRCQYYKSSFQIEIILLCQCFQIKVRHNKEFSSITLYITDLDHKRTENSWLLWGCFRFTINSVLCWGFQNDDPGCLLDSKGTQYTLACVAWRFWLGALNNKSK